MDGGITSPHTSFAPSTYPHPPHSPVYPFFSHTINQGALTDFVRCQSCGKEAAREDTFLDLSLVLKVGDCGERVVREREGVGNMCVCVGVRVCVCMCVIQRSLHSPSPPHRTHPSSHTHTHQHTPQQPFGAKQVMHRSVAEALAYFLQPETLEGDNQVQ
jgi:hypothetical protein